MRRTDQGFSQLRGAYEHPTLGDGGRHDPFAAADLALCDRVGAVLKQHYPLHPIRVKVSHKAGIVQIQALQGWGDYWYIVKIRDLDTDPSMKRIVRAIGEVFERMGMSRQNFNVADWHAAWKANPIGATRHSGPPGG